MIERQIKYHHITPIGNSYYTMTGIITFFFCIFLNFYGSTNYALAQKIEDAISKGNDAYSSSEYEKAEKLFQSVLEKDARNYRVLKSLAKTKIKLKKLNIASGK